ncbi:MAG: SynChlorMet cassette protein ScmD [Methanothrix sp.]
MEIKPIANPLVVFREEFDDWAILFDPESGKAFGINPIGARIWSKLDGKHDLSEIVQHIQNFFDNVSLDVEAHVGKFINDLVKNGLAGYEGVNE